jgi:hypothetical protein
MKCYKNNVLGDYGKGKRRRPKGEDVMKEEVYAQVSKRRDSGE